MKEYVVTGKRRRDQNNAFKQQHKALNEVNVLSAQQIDQTTSKTVGEAVQQLPGVSTQYDTGEPRFAQIRGSEADLNIVAYNGTILPSYFPGLRAVPLDSIPTGLVGNIESHKTLLPDMDGEGIGGQFNLVPNKASDYPGSYTELTAQGGLVPLRNTYTDYFNANWANTFDLGGGQKLGLLVSGLFEDKFFGIDDLEEAYSSPSGTIPTNKSISSYVFRYYKYERLRAGLGTNIDLNTDPDNHWGLYVAAGGFDERREPRDETIYNNLDVNTANGATVNPDGSFTVNPNTNSGGGAGVVTKTREDTLQQNRFLTIMGEGDHKFGGIGLDYKASYCYANQYQPYFYFLQFQSLPGAITGTVTYNNSANNGDNPVFNTGNLSGQNTAANYTYNSLKNESFSSTDQSWGGQADVTISAGGDDFAKAGLSANVRNRNMNQTYSAWNSNGTNLYLNQVQDPNTYNIYPDQYPMGPVLGGNADNAAMSSQYGTPVDETLFNKVGTWSAQEFRPAAYAMYVAKPDSQFTIIAGGRVEGTYLNYNYNQPVFDVSNNLIGANPKSSSKNYVDWLPNVNFKWEIPSDWVIRLSYTRSLALPTFQQYVPGIENGDLQSTIPGTEAVAGQTYGNDSLGPIISDNVDASYEFYPMKGAVLNVGLFDKEITNYIKQDYTINTAGGANISFSAIPHSRIYGADAEYEQQYTFLPDPLDGIGLRGSLCLDYSGGQIHPGMADGPLPGQSSLVWAAGVFYRKGNWNFDIGGSFSGHSLLAVGNPVSGSADTYLDDHFQIDGRIQYAIDKNFLVYVDGVDLNDAYLRFYAGDPQHPLQKEHYGVQPDLGITATF